MSYTESQQKMVNRMGTMMICYLIIALLMLVLNGWTIIDILCTVCDVVLFAMYQFTEIDKRVIAGMAIVVGAVSLLLATAWMTLFGLLLMIYAIILIVKLSK